MNKPLENVARIRVVVIGAGIVGASIAFHLSRRGADVTVVDKDQPGSGASGCSFAWINSFQKHPAHYADLNRRSLDIWDRFARRLGADIGLRWGGRLQWVENETDAERLRADIHRLQESGYASRAMGEAEVRRLEPGLVTGRLALAAINDNEGIVDPPKVIDACLRCVARNGGAVRTDRPVTGFVLNGKGGVTAVETPSGNIPCDIAVVAAGVGTTPLAATAGVNVPQEHSPGVLIRTDARPPVLKTVSAIYPPAAEDGLPVHLRQSADGVVVIGVGSQEDAAADDSQAHANDLLRRASHFLPDLTNASAIPMLVAYRPMPTDGLPVLGFADAVPNLYVAVTHSGITLAPLIGELTTMEIVDGATVGLLEPYRLRRFSG